MIPGNMGIRVFGGENTAVVVVDFETEKAVVLPGQEYETAKGLAERINGLLEGGERGIAEEYKKAFDWLKKHANELREPPKERCAVFEQQDANLLVMQTIQDYKKSKRLTQFEKAAITRGLRQLSFLEKKVFILKEVFGLSIRDIGKVLNLKAVHEVRTRMMKKLKKIRKKEKKPGRYIKTGEFGS